MFNIKIKNIVKEGKFMKALEEFCIYSQTQCGNEINRKFTLGLRRLFDVTVQYEKDRSRRRPYNLPFNTPGSRVTHQLSLHALHTSEVKNKYSRIADYVATG
jgi:hypothetical protein